MPLKKADEAANAQTIADQKFILVSNFNSATNNPRIGEYVYPCPLVPAVLLCLPRLLSLLLLLRVDVPCALRLEQDRPEVGRTNDGAVSGVLTRAPGLHLIPGPGLRSIRGEQDMAVGVDHRVGDSPGKLLHAHEIKIISWR